MLEYQEILTRAYAAFNERDIDAVLNYMHPDVDWANGMEGGRVHGHQGLREYWTRQWDLINPHVEPTGFRTDGDGRIIVDVHQVVRDLDGNILMETMLQHVYRMQDGLVTRMDIREEQGTKMKTIGLLGGMSWESSIEYYRIINETTKAKLGGLHSAKSLMVSVDFADVEILQHQGRWAEAASLLINAAKSLENGGADFIVMCTNTMHKVAEELEANVEIPLLHIADPTAQRVKESGIQNIGLLGTRFTMEEEFYKGRLSQKFGLNVNVPNAGEREIVHRVIYDELVLGKIDPRSKAQYIDIMEQMVRRGAEGIILGCTEIGLLVHPEDSQVPLFDTTRIHAEAAVDYALQE